MSRKDEETNLVKTFTTKSNQPLSVIAGGGIFGFGGIGIYKPQESKPHSIGVDLNEKPEAFGQVFSYDEIARVIIDDKTAWINNRLPDAPKERQDITGTGMLTIEFFDKDEIRAVLQEKRDAFRFLGLDL